MTESLKKKRANRHIKRTWVEKRHNALSIPLQSCDHQGKTQQMMNYQIWMVTIHLKRGEKKKELMFIE